MGTYPDLTIKVIDSKGLSLAQLFLVQETIEMTNQGLPIDDVERGILDLIPQVSLYASLGTLDNAIKGGRIGGVKALATSALNILPIVQLVDGDLKIIQSVRGPNIGRKRMVERVRREVNSKGLPTKLGVMYTKDREIGEELKDLLGDIWREGGVELIGPTEAGPV